MNKTLKLQCNCCRKTIGYLDANIFSDSDAIRQVCIHENTSTIYCPECLVGMNDNVDNADSTDLIDRNVLKAKLSARRNNSEVDLEKGLDLGIGIAINLLENMPSAK